MPTDVSILIPYYNRREQFERSLWLLTRQSHANLSIVIIDDGSKPDQKIDDLVSPFYPRVKVIRIRKSGAPPRSPNKAWNAAFQMSNGEFVITSHPEIMVPKDAVERILINHEGPQRSVPIQFCIATAEQYHRIDRVRWKESLDELKRLPDFWSAMGPWGYSNLSADQYRSHLSFSGGYRDDWLETAFDLQVDEGFLPDVADPNFTADDAWMHKRELEIDRPSRGVPVEVYHQHHDRVYGNRPQASPRVRRIIESDRERAREWKPR